MSSILLSKEERNLSVFVPYLSVWDWTLIDLLLPLQSYGWTVHPSDSFPNVPYFCPPSSFHEKNSSSSSSSLRWEIIRQCGTPYLYQSSQYCPRWEILYGGYHVVTIISTVYRFKTHYDTIPTSSHISTRCIEQLYHEYRHELEIILNKYGISQDLQIPILHYLFLFSSSSS